MNNLNEIQSLLQEKAALPHYPVLYHQHPVRKIRHLPVMCHHHDGLPEHIGRIAEKRCDLG